MLRIDHVVEKLFTSSSDYLSKIISNVINIPVEDYEVELELIHPNEHITDDELDIITDIDDLTVYIEVYDKRENENTKYICHIKLKNVNEDLTTKIIQINLNNYDITEKGLLITKTVMYNRDIQEPLHNFIEIYDVNLEYLANISCNDVKCEDKNSLVRLLYLLVNSNEEELRLAYEGDNFMNKMIDHAKELRKTMEK